MGKHGRTAKGVKQLLDAKVPLVIDADAINIIAENNWTKKIPKGSIISPHIKEFERLTGKAKNSIDRLQKQRELSKKRQITIILKGAHTSISTADGKIYYNNTGNPGMATAGSGDVLTGIVLAFCAQGYTTKEAAILSVYIHGKAGDIAKKQAGEQALTANDIINCIGKSFLKLRIN